MINEKDAMKVYDWKERSQEGSLKKVMLSMSFSEPSNGCWLNEEQKKGSPSWGNEMASVSLC